MELGECGMHVFQFQLELNAQSQRNRILTAYQYPLLCISVCLIPLSETAGGIKCHDSPE